MAELNRPIYEALVTSEDAGMLRISLVDLPAVESNFLAFAKEDGESCAGTGTMSITSSSGPTPSG